MGVLCDLDTRRVMMSEIQQFSQHDIEVLNEETVRLQSFDKKIEGSVFFIFLWEYYATSILGE